MFFGSMNLSLVQLVFSLFSPHRFKNHFRLGVPSSVIDSSSKFICLLPLPYSSFLRPGQQLNIIFFQVGGEKSSMRSGRQHCSEAFTLTRAHHLTFSCSQCFSFATVGPRVLNVRMLLCALCQVLVVISTLYLVFVGTSLSSTLKEISSNRSV